MKKLGKKELIIHLDSPITKTIDPLAAFNLTIATGGNQLIFTYTASNEDSQVTNLLDALKQNSIKYKGLTTRQSSLEEIFIQLIGKL